ncbi:MAG: ABC transporter permease [Lishizhenia sp.]|nr:ABC transporter permease [Lishizhenia sp.]
MSDSLPTRIYSSKKELSFWRVLREGLGALRKSNFLALQLAKRDIKAQYRQSFLGLLWSLILPLSTALVWVLLRSSNTVNLGEVNVNYVLFVFVGTLSWSILTESILGPMNMVLSMRTTLSKINFPKEALITSSVYKTGFNTLVKLIILLVLMLIYPVEMGGSMLFFPVSLFALFLVGTAIGLFITPLGLLIGDVGKILTPLMQVLMYVSPVVFMTPKPEGFFGKLVYYNPLTPLISNFRNALLGLPLEQMSYYLMTGIAAIIVFCLALVVFRITIPIITERIGG